MNQKLSAQHKLRNLIHTLLLIGGMSLLLAICSELLLGEGVWPWVFIGVAIVIYTLPDLSSHWVLRLYQARPFSPRDAPQLIDLTRELARRAGLDQAPKLYWIPSQTVNAFAVGNRNNATIAITDGLLGLLTPRELAGVMAHEMSHISNNDMRLMGLADIISRMTHAMSMVGLFLILFSLPLMLLGVAMISFWGALLLLFAPTLSALLQLALSRIREFDADLEAAGLTGDPQGLASALSKIDQRHGSLWQRLLFPGYRDPEPSLLRTHPDTDERIERLMELSGRPDGFEPTMARQYFQPVILPPDYRVIRVPRHRMMFGIWN